MFVIILILGMITASAIFILSGGLFHAVVSLFIALVGAAIAVLLTITGIVGLAAAVCFVISSIFAAFGKGVRQFFVELSGVSRRDYQLSRQERNMLRLKNPHSPGTNAHRRFEADRDFVKTFDHRSWVARNFW